MLRPLQIPLIAIRLAGLHAMMLDIAMVNRILELAVLVVTAQPFVMDGMLEHGAGVIITIMA
jgi:hypothetical protein